MSLKQLVSCLATKDDKNNITHVCKLILHHPGKHKCGLIHFIDHKRTACGHEW